MKYLGDLFSGISFEWLPTHVRLLGPGSILIDNLRAFCLAPNFCLPILHPKSLSPKFVKQIKRWVFIWRAQSLIKVYYILCTAVLQARAGNLIMKYLFSSEMWALLYYLILWRCEQCLPKRETLGPRNDNFLLTLFFRIKQIVFFLFLFFFVISPRLFT